jgi:exodeoxyribonuclease VII large subunit
VSQQAALFEPEQTLGVGELVARVTKVVAAAFPTEVWVRGEVHGLKRPNASGHVYFELCERNSRRGPTSTLNIALFRLEHQRVQRTLADYPDFRLADGLEVRVKGRIQFAYGRVSLVMSAIDPVHTLGQLAADRQRVLRALAADGLLETQRALPMPVVPLRVGLVTSVGSAAYEDAVQELTTSGIGFDVRVADARVQGTNADLSMVRALSVLKSQRCDVVLLVRGGGSRTDLVAFDSERLARAVASMPVPVLAGVGHEIDSSVVDEVAHASFKTPTACAAAVVERTRGALGRAETAWTAVASAARADLAAAGARVDDRGRRVASATSAGLRRADHALDGAAARISPARLDAVLRGAERTLDDHARRLRRAGRATAEARARQLDVLAAQVAAADPTRLLARGWSLTRTAEGRLVRSPDDAPPGTEVITTLAAGRLRSQVLDDH